MSRDSDGEIIKTRIIDWNLRIIKEAWSDVKIEMKQRTNYIVHLQEGSLRSHTNCWLVLY